MNLLKDSTSPYLLQHADNPVHWHEWNDESIAKAKVEDKPVFLSIGYAACHWCHVMAHESFENEEIAAIMNEHFINIKVDREERPDIDSIYMKAVIALTRQGGWPMSVFLTPDLRPFYGGTYFPPEPRYQMPSFPQLLLGIADSWKKDRTNIDLAGAQLTKQLQTEASMTASGKNITAVQVENATKRLTESYDWQNGGWGAAPKFPQTMAIEFLLRDSESYTGKSAPLHALDAMARGGIYDVVGGGFARYSTDAQWLVPHFEKMLYDNALLTRAYLHAWQRTGKAHYRQICEETLGFIARETTHPDGGFYSSLDADSEGVEGKFYVWEKEEIEDLLGDDYTLFEAAYGISATGNWEGKTVLQRTTDDLTLAARFALDPELVPAKLTSAHKKLLIARDKRIRPGTDDKVLTEWNGLMLIAIAEAARIFDNKDYLNMATRNADFLLTALRPSGQLRRSWREGKAGSEVFLADYAALILGLLELYQTDFNNRWFIAAQELADEMIEKFGDPEGGFFDTTNEAAEASSLPIRPKELQDNAIPSGNSLAAEALLKLDAITGKTEYRQLAEKTLALVSEFVSTYPTAFSQWLSGADLAIHNAKQVAIVGDLGRDETKALLAEIRSSYRPNMVVAQSPYPIPEDAPELLKGRALKNNLPTAYVCEGFSCKLPVNTASQLRDQVNR
ncbi:MAG: thioredoxin domain-containing protein [Chloroflexi bacterium]|nr:thioredoxin domain-containing protein [Chloroflexota bacterium]